MADRKLENNGFSGEPQKPIPDFDPSPKPKRNMFALACATLASMTSILLGYDIGVMSGAGLFIKDDLKISGVQLEVLMGILNVYSLLGSAAAGRTSDWIGRRYIIVGRREPVLWSETVIDGHDYDTGFDDHINAEVVESIGGCTASGEPSTMEVNNER
ncbi:hypothetical protein CsSME_00029862 [Camellia sinensis var. sinensis]